MESMWNLWGLVKYRQCMLLSLSTLVQMSSDPSPLIFFHITSRGHIAVSDVATNHQQLSIYDYNEQCASEQLHTHPSPFHFLAQEAGATLVLVMWQPNGWMMTNSSQHLGEQHNTHPLLLYSHKKQGTHHCWQPGNDKLMIDR